MRRLALLLLLALSACGLFNRQAPAPRYVVGAPYQSDGVWRYPREDFTFTDTGLATVYERRGLTASGEAFDATALAAAHPTLQLPAIARITNLENGRQIRVRINDRGPDPATRTLGLTRRAAELLGAPGTTGLRVKVQVQEAESRRLAGEAAPAPAPIAVAAAPRGAIQAESLTPPPGARPGAGASRPAEVPVAQAAAPAAETAVPQRLPEEVFQTAPAPGRLTIECGAFSAFSYATVQRDRLLSMGARISTDYYAPRDRAFIVRLATYPSIAAAEAALRRVLPLVPDARIVVE